jgi:hypothetical protein
MRAVMLPSFSLPADKREPPMPTLSSRSARSTSWLTAIAATTAISLFLFQSPAQALVRPARETTHAALWRKLYDQLPDAWKSKEVVVVREVSDREMDRLVREHGDGPSRDSEDADEVQGFFEFTGPRENVPTIVLRESLADTEAAFVFTHEYGHFVWEEKLSNREQDDYFRIWNRQRRARRLVSPYAEDSVAEGFAEAFAHYVRRPAQLHRKDAVSEEFLQEWLDSRSRPANTEAAR